MRPFGSGLVRDQGHAQHALGFLATSSMDLHHLDAAALAAAAGMDLRLHHPDRAARISFAAATASSTVNAALPRGTGTPKAAQHVFRLIFVDVHSRTLEDGRMGRVIAAKFEAARIQGPGAAGGMSASIAS